MALTWSKFSSIQGLFSLCKRSWVHLSLIYIWRPSLWYNYDDFMVDWCQGHMVQWSRARHWSKDGSWQYSQWTSVPDETLPQSWSHPQDEPGQVCLLATNNSTHHALMLMVHCTVLHFVPISWLFALLIMYTSMLCKLSHSKECLIERFSMICLIGGSTSQSNMQ